MQLFKSDWIVEPARRAGMLEWTRPQGRRRYGACGGRPMRPACPPPALADAPELGLIEHERELLRRLAARDRAA